MGAPSERRLHIPDNPTDISNDPVDVGSQTPRYEPEWRIGNTLARLTQELIAAARLMGDILEPASSGLVTDAIRTLEHQVYRIAIIGQIKAGKSSFVNALV